MATNLVRISRALISVSDKTRLVEFGRELTKRGVEILSTGGSAQHLRDSGISAIDVSEYTGFPEILDGRVKTLHPKIHGGILGCQNLDSHLESLIQHSIPLIDLVVVNLYPFSETVNRGSQFEECIDNIDIGGFALIRAAAKNHNSVVVITDPGRYRSLIDEMDANNGSTLLKTRRNLAKIAYTMTSNYDAAIASWFPNE